MQSGQYKYGLRGHLQLALGCTDDSRQHQSNFQILQIWKTKHSQFFFFMITVWISHIYQLEVIKSIDYKVQTATAVVLNWFCFRTQIFYIQHQVGHVHTANKFDLSLHFLLLNCILYTHNSLKYRSDNRINSRKIQVVTTAFTDFLKKLFLWLSGRALH